MMDYKAYSHYNVLSLIVAPLVLTSTLVWSNPQVPTVTQGNASFNGINTNHLTITNTPNTVINWQQFNIKKSEVTEFLQQNANSTVLNRITGVDPSTILGQLISNGKVFIINPNGLVFGQNSVIDTAGFMASTLNMTDDDFLSGNFNFKDIENASEILNKGFIHTTDDGNIILIAPTIKNEGTIATEGGDITLAAGQSVTLSNLDSPHITFEVQASDNQAINLGDMLTKGGSASIFASSIVQNGQINANTISTDANGNIVLGATNDIKVNGLISNQSLNAQGGSIQILGDHITIESDARIIASGATGGGTVLIGGDQQGLNLNIKNALSTTIDQGAEVHADATAIGNGGNVIVFANDDVHVHGEVTAKGGDLSGNGGFIETSGLQALDITAVPDASAVNGENGEWLIDPNNIVIQAGGLDTNISGTPNHNTTENSAILTTSTIVTALNSGTNVVVTTTTSGANSQNGSITVQDEIVTTPGAANTTLTLSAHDDIDIDANIIASGANGLNLILIPDSDYTNGTGKHANLNATLDLNGGDLTVTGGSGILDIEIDTNNGIFFRDLTYANANIGTYLGYGGTLHGGTMNTVNLNTGAADHFSIDDVGINGINAVINVSGDLTFYGNFIGTGTLITSNTSTTDLSVNSGNPVTNMAMHWDWDNFGTVDIGGTNTFTDLDLHGTFTNKLGAIVNLNGVSSSEITTDTGFTGIFNNEGTINTLLSNTTRTFTSGITFNNSGVINLSIGNLQIDGPGTDTGTWNISTSRTLTINLSTLYTFSNTSIIQGAGTFKVSNGIVDFDSSNLNMSHLSLSGGTLNINTNNTYSGTFLFNKATLGGTAEFTTTGITTLGTADDATIATGATWKNEGTVTWTGSTNDTFNINGTFINEASGIFNIETTSDTQDFNGTATSIFTNNGTINKGFLGQDIETEINIPFSNVGTVNVDSGTLLIDSVGTDSGTYDVDLGAVLNFRPNIGENFGFLQTRVFTGLSAIQGAGDVRFRLDANASIDIDGIYNILGKTSIDVYDDSAFNAVMDFSDATVNSLGSTYEQKGLAGNDTQLQAILLPATLNLSNLETIALSVGTFIIPDNTALTSLTTVSNSFISSSSIDFGNNDVSTLTSITLGAAAGTLTFGGNITSTNVSVSSGSLIFDGDLVTSDLLVSSGTLNLNGTSIINNVIGDNFITNGTININGTATATNGFNWSKGTLGGTGDLLIPMNTTSSWGIGGSDFFLKALTLSNSGTINYIENDSSIEELTFTNGGSLVNNGTFNMSGPFADIRGSVAESFINNGTVNVLNTGTGFKVPFLAMSNSVINVSNAAVLNIDEISIDSSAINPANFTGNGEVWLINGTHNFTDGSAINGNLHWSQGTLTGKTSAATLSIQSGSILSIGELGGDLTLSDAILQNDGTINYIENDSIIDEFFLTNSASLVNNGVFNMSGQYADMRGESTESFINNGTVNVLETATGITLPFMAMSNSTTNVSNAAILYLDEISIDSSVLNPANFTGAGQIWLTNGTHTFTDGSAINGDLHWSGGTLSGKTSAATISILSGSTFTLGELGTDLTLSDAILQNNGTIDYIESDSIHDLFITNSAKLNNAGDFNWIGQFGSISSSNTGTFNNTGTITKSGVGTDRLINPTNFNNVGGIIDIQSGSIGFTGTTLTLDAGSVLSGSGIINDNVVNDGGLVSPGSGAEDIATLSINGSYTQNTGSTLSINFAGDTTPGTDYDELKATGAITLDGTLLVNTNTGYTPSNDTNFMGFVNSTTSLAGAFVTVTGSGFDFPTYDYVTNFTSDIIFSNNQSVFFDNSNGDFLWNIASNWSNDLLPTSSSDVFINQTGQTILLTSGNQSINSLSMTNGDLTITGGSLSVASGFTLNGNLDNQAILTLNGLINTIGGSLNNTGFINVTTKGANNAVLTLPNLTTLEGTIVLNSTAGGQAELVSISDQTLTGTLSSVGSTSSNIIDIPMLTIASGTLDISHDLDTTNTVLQLDAGSTTHIASDQTINNGTVNWHGGSLAGESTTPFSDLTAFTYDGDISIDGVSLSYNADFNIGNAKLTLNSGELIVKGNSTLTSNNALIVNDGLFDITGNFTSNGELDINGGLVQVLGQLNSDVNNESTLEVIGSINGDVTNGGVLSPGIGDASFTQLNINGDYAQVGQGELRIEVKGSTQIIDYDVLKITGDVLLSNDLNLVSINGFSPTLPSSYKFLKASNTSEIVGTFDGEIFKDSGFTLPIYASNGVLVEYIDGSLVTFLNTGSIDLTLASNWSGGVVPDINTNVIINLNGSTLLTISSLFEVKSISTTENLTVNSNGNFIVAGESTFNNDLTINNGSAQFDGTTNFNGDLTLNGASLSGSGILIANNNIDITSASILSSVLLNNTSGNILSMTGDLTLSNGASLNNSGTLDIARDSNILSDGTGSIFNTGNIIKSSGNAALNIETGIINTGTIDIQGSGGANLAGNFTQSGGSLSSEGDIAVSGFTVWTGGSMNSGGTYFSDGGIAITGGVTLDRTLNNNGVGLLSGNGAINGSGSFINNGNFGIQNDTLVTVDVTNFGEISKTNSSGVTTINGAFINNGNLHLESGSILFGSTFVQNSGEFINNATITVASLVINDGFVGGNSIINGDVVFNGGELSPGNSVGQININGDLLLSDDSLLTMESSASTIFDVINVSGTAVYDGTMTVTFIEGYTGSVSDTYDYINYSNVSGEFDVINAPLGYSFTNNNTSTGQIFTLTGVTSGTSGDFGGNTDSDTTDTVVSIDPFETVALLDTSESINDNLIDLSLLYTVGEQQSDDERDQEKYKSINVCR